MMNNFNNFGFPVEKNNIYTNQVGNTNQSIFGNSGYMVPTKPMDYDGYFGSQTKKPSFWDKTKMFFSQYGSKIFGWGITIFGGLGAFALGKKFIDLDVPYGKGQPKPADDDSFLRKFKYNVCTFLSDTVGIMKEYKVPTKDPDSVAPAATAGAATSSAESKPEPAAEAVPAATAGAATSSAESKPEPAAEAVPAAPAGAISDPVDIQKTVDEAIKADKIDAIATLAAKAAEAIKADKIDAILDAVSNKIEDIVRGAYNIEIAYDAAEADAADAADADAAVVKANYFAAVFASKVADKVTAGAEKVIAKAKEFAAEDT